MAPVPKTEFIRHTIGTSGRSQAPEPEASASIASRGLEVASGGIGDVVYLRLHEQLNRWRITVVQVET